MAVPYRRGQPATRDNVDVAAPCGAIVSCVTDFLKWQQLHLRQAAHACERHQGHGPLVAPCRLRQAAAGGEGLLLSDAQWAKLLTPNTIMPDFNTFGTYTLGLWFEQYHDAFLMHHAGDVEGMASKQAMLPELGHSIVVLSNENESPARFAILLAILDHLLGLAPPVPSWEERYLASLAEEAAADRAADSKRRSEVEAVPMEGRKPRWALSKYCGSYAHPACELPRAPSSPKPSLVFLPATFSTNNFLLAAAAADPQSFCASVQTGTRRSRSRPAARPKPAPSKSVAPQPSGPPTPPLPLGNPAVQASCT